MESMKALVMGGVLATALRLHRMHVLEQSGSIRELDPGIKTAIGWPLTANQVMRSKLISYATGDASAAPANWRHSHARRQAADNVA
jgi:hypothetical protein